MSMISNPDVLILYASQTGCSESIARAFNSEAHEKGLNTAVHPISDDEKTFSLSTAKLAVFIISSTGQGDPPEHSVAFMRKMRTKNRNSPKWLSQLRFALLGLGDSNYDEFQGNPKQLARLLAAAGASEFFPRGEADDALGLEDVVEPWKANVTSILTTLLSQSVAPSTTEPIHSTSSDSFSPIDSTSTPPTSNDPPETTTQSSLVETTSPASHSSTRPTVFKVTNAPKVPPCLIRLEITEHLSNDTPRPALPFAESATLVAHRHLSDQDRLVIDLTLEHDAPLTYSPGDALALHCANPQHLVDALLSRLKIEQPDQILRVLPADPSALYQPDDIPSHLRSLFTIRHAFLYLLDISHCPRKFFLQMLSTFTSDPAEKSQLAHLASRSGSSDYDQFIHQHEPNLLTLLQLFPSCQPPLLMLINHLPPLLPRYYSICSSPLESPTKTRLLVGITRLQTSTPQQPRYGLASQYLLNLTAAAEAPPRVATELRHSTRFVLRPEMNSVPILLVATGTGLSPFLSFLEDRQARLHQGQQLADCILYYGCQNRIQLEWFSHELEAYVHSGALTKVFYALSREPSQKKLYVQHRIEESQELVRSVLIDQSGYCFVCGSHDMTKGLYETLNRCLDPLGSSTSNFKQFHESGHYILDVW